MPFKHLVSSGDVHSPFEMNIKYLFYTVLDIEKNQSATGQLAELKKNMNKNM